MPAHKARILQALDHVGREARHGLPVAVAGRGLVVQRDLLHGGGGGGWVVMVVRCCRAGEDAAHTTELTERSRRCGAGPLLGRKGQMEGLSGGSLACQAWRWVPGNSAAG